MLVHLQTKAPDPAIGHLVNSFWLLENPTHQTIAATILPDGMVDLFFLRTESLHLELKCLDTEPSEVTIPPNMRMLAIGLKLPAIEQLFHTSIATALNSAQNATNTFWQFDETDYNNFDRFCKKATKKIRSIPDTIDPRKTQLFDLLYSENGALTVKELAEKTFWPARQINRYFTQQFGLSLKAYSNILRFRASFDHIKKGKLFPEQNFFDQAHFIKAVKKLSGVVPKTLRQNKNDRFLQFSALPKK